MAGKSREELTQEMLELGRQMMIKKDDKDIEISGEMNEVRISVNVKAELIDNE